MQAAAKPEVAARPKRLVLVVFSRSITAELLQRGLGIVNSVLMMRALGAETTGHYLFLMAILSTFPMVLSSLDQALTRFLGSLNGQPRTDLAASVLSIKLLWFAAMLVLTTLCWQVGWVPAAMHDASLRNGGLLLICMVTMFALAPPIAGWANRVLAANRDYAFHIASDLGQALATTAWLAFAFLVLRLRALDVIIAGMTVLATLGTLIKLARTHRIDPAILRAVGGGLMKPQKAVLTLFTPSNRQYFIPFFFTSLSGFLKDLFPLLVVGAVTAAQTVAEFRVVQQLFRTAHSIVPNAFEIVRPSLLDKNSDEENFLRRYQRYANGYLLASTAFGALVMLALAPILALWGLKPSPVLLAVTLALAAELLFGAATHIEYQIFLLQDRTGYLIFMSVVRQIVTAAATVLLGVPFGAAGVALGTLAGALYAWLGFAAYTLHMRSRPAADLVKVVWVTVLLACALGGVGAVAAWALRF